MNFPIVREYQTDIKGINPDNLIVNEPKHIEPGEFTRVVVPRHAPFFVNSELSLNFPNGEPMIPDVHYRVFRIMNRMVEMTGKSMACMIELLDDSITDFVWSYRTVGHFSLIDQTLLELVTTSANDDRFVYWQYLRGKPVVFPPKLHGHSLLYEIYMFQDVIDMLDMYLAYMEGSGAENITILVNHYTDLINNYIEVYQKSLGDFLARHKASVNAHGFTKDQAKLSLVDNFATANSGNILQERKDLSLTPDGLRTIVETYGFDSDQFLPADMLPISRFGNTNFIPPSIDGSFEGLGSKAETCGICLEKDGSVVLLGNRFDGRVNGLYFSVLTDYKDPTKAKQAFSGYRYNHPKFLQDGVNVDQIVQGSGKDIIMVGDSTSQRFYLGVTNGTLDPSKHVYCEIDVKPILRAVYSNITTVGQRPSDWSFRFSISVIGSWVYICFSHYAGSVDAPSLWGNSCDFKYLWKVPLASIRLLNDLTPVRQNVSFVDFDGVQVNNATRWRWGTRTFSGQNTSRYLLNFTPYPDELGARMIYAQPMLAAQNPQTGEWAIKFQGYYYVASNTQGKASYVHVEVNYLFNPDTGVMTLLGRTTMPDINFATWDTSSLTDDWASQITGDQSLGMVIFDDGTLATSHTIAGGYPWFSRFGNGLGVSNPYQLVSQIWRGNLPHSKQILSVNEAIVPPVASSVNPKPPYQFPTGELMATANRDDPFGTIRVYFKAITGKYQTRAGLTNLVVNGIVGRPLTNNVKKVNMDPAMGGSIVSVPSGSLDTYGIEVGASALCMSVQRKFLDRSLTGTRWGDSGGQDDIVLIDTHNMQAETDGTLSVVPTSEILYPATIIAQLKQRVESVAIMNASPKVIVSINDPTGYLTNKFGYLPVIVAITYIAPATKVRYNTFMTIQPTYSTSGSRRTVTGFTVIDIGHFNSGTFDDVTSTNWPCWLTGQSGRDASWVQQPMRTHYYLSADGSLDVHLDPAVQANALGDVQGRICRFNIPDRSTKRWSNFNIYTRSVNNMGFCCTPDNGIVEILPLFSSTGGAAVIGNGGVNKPLLASVYPEIGWVLFFNAVIDVVFNGRHYSMPSGNIDLRDIDSSPSNKTFYVYCKYEDGKAVYEVTTAKLLESAFLVWVSTITTNASQIVTVNRSNMFAIRGHRVTETKQGNAIPAASGLVAEEGQIPWLTAGELTS